MDENMLAQLHRDLGRIEALQANTAAQLREIKEYQTLQDRRIAEIHDVIVAAGGGWRALAISASIGAAAAAAVLNFKKLLGIL